MLLTNQEHNQELERPWMQHKQIKELVLRSINPQDLLRALIKNREGEGKIP
jgi:hypothetical protein